MMSSGRCARCDATPIAAATRTESVRLPVSKCHRSGSAWNCAAYALRAAVSRDGSIENDTSFTRLSRILSCKRAILAEVAGQVPEHCGRINAAIHTRPLSASLETDLPSWSLNENAGTSGPGGGAPDGDTLAVPIIRLSTVGPTMRAARNVVPITSRKASTPIAPQRNARRTFSTVPTSHVPSWYRPLDWLRWRPIARLAG